MMGFGDRLRAVREAAGYETPEKAAAYAGLGSTTVRKWEDGTSSPVLPGFRALCELYKLSPRQVCEVMGYTAARRG